VLAGIRIPVFTGGRARTRPETVIAGAAYSAAAYRAMLHKRGITVVIPQHIAEPTTSTSFPRT
jgi:hypothetical protein